ncbi:MAG: Ig-like domain-containing protein [Muribaculaceae bacterium]|nr:Ig-like domain-containing protein [Muribaculaceae bacterium]
MKKFITMLALLLAVIGFTAKAGAWSSEKDYYIDPSACSWFYGDGAVIKIWDGNKDVETEKLIDGTTKFRLDDTAEATIYIKRCNPADGQQWGNSRSVTAPDDENYNLIVTGANFDSDNYTWSTYTATVIAGSWSTTKDYYVNLSACTWFKNADCVPVIWDGAAAVAAEEVENGIYKFRLTNPGENGYIKILRHDPTAAAADQSYNTLAVAATDDETLDMIVTGANFDTNPYTWSTYVAGEDPSPIEPDPVVAGVWSTEKDYYIDATACTFFYDADAVIKIWDGAQDVVAEMTADGKSKFRLTNPGTDGKIYIKRHDPVTGDKWGGDADQFAVSAPEDDLMNMIVTGANFADGYTWGTYVAQEPDPINPDPVEPVISDDTFTANVVKMDVSGTATVEVTLNAAEGKEYCNAQWDIVIPDGYWISEVTLNEAVCADHTLLINQVDNVMKCIAYSNNNTVLNTTVGYMFSFTIGSNGDATVGELNIAINNILVCDKPVDGTTVTNKFADANLGVQVVKKVDYFTAQPEYMTLKEGDSDTFVITVEPADATDKTYSWEVVEGNDIIDFADGTVTAKAQGSATIKVTANDGFGAELTLYVTVDGKYVESITLNETESTLYVGDSIYLNATCAPEDATNTNCIWSSSDEAVAKVDQNGQVSAVGAGQATITATTVDGSNVSASCIITVKPHISGDADGDDLLTIADVVIIANKAIENDLGGIFENMDINSDGVITVEDVTLAVTYLLEQAPAALPVGVQISSNKLALTAPVVLNENTINLPLYLPEAKSVAGIMFDIVLPEGTALTKESYVAPYASNGHSIALTQLAANTYRVAIYSAKTFVGNNLGYLTIKTEKNGLMDFDINNVSYSDGCKLMTTDDARYTFDVNTNGVESIYGDDANAEFDVYSISGIKVADKANKAVVKALPAGIYVINGNKVAVY